MATRHEQPNEVVKDASLGVSFSKIADNERYLWPLIILQDYTSEEGFFSFKEDAIKDLDSMKYTGDAKFEELTPIQKRSQLTKMKIFHRVLKYHSEFPYNYTDPNNNEDFQVLPNSLPFELNGSFDISNLSQLNKYSIQMKEEFERSLCDKQSRKQNAENFNIAYESILRRLKHTSITTKETSILCLCLLYCQQRGLTRRYIDGSKVRSFQGMLQELLQGNKIAPLDSYYSAENQYIIRRLEGILKSGVMNGLQEILARRATVFRLNVAIVVTVCCLVLFSI